MKNPVPGDWQSVQGVNAVRYTCGHCQSLVSSNQGWNFLSPNRQPTNLIRVCPQCNRPSYFEEASQLPGVTFGADVGSLPPNVEALYTEARRSSAGAAHTAAVLACRKLLMHIAVEKGAKPGESFESYVEFLADKGYVPPDGKAWVDHIRKKGNEANHEIVLMGQTDAQDLLVFLEMLLKFIYEFPRRIPATPGP